MEGGKEGKGNDKRSVPANKNLRLHRWPGCPISSGVGCDGTGGEIGLRNSIQPRAPKNFNPALDTTYPSPTFYNTCDLYTVQN